MMEGATLQTLPFVRKTYGSGEGARGSRETFICVPFRRCPTPRRARAVTTGHIRFYTPSSPARLNHGCTGGRAQLLGSTPAYSLQDGRKYWSGLDDCCMSPNSVDVVPRPRDPLIHDEEQGDRPQDAKGACQHTSENVKHEPQNRVGIRRGDVARRERSRRRRRQRKGLLRARKRRRWAR